MDITLHAELGEIDELGARWRDLAAADPAATVFQTPDYAHVWWEEFGALRQLVLIEMADGGAARGIAAMSLEPDGSLRFLGDPSVTDYLAPVSRPDDRDAVAAVIVETALGLDGFERLSLSGLAADSGWIDALGRAAKAAGLAVQELPEDVCPVVGVPGSFDAYLAALPGKLRHEVRRKERRLRDATGFTVRLAEADSLDRDLQSFFALHRSSTGPKGKFITDDMASYFTRFAHAMLGRGWLRFALLEVAGSPVAGIFGFSREGTWSVYNSAYDHAHRELSVGMVLVGECIRMAAEEGCATFDFLRGSEEYKYRFGAVDRPVVRLEAGAE